MTDDPASRVACDVPLDTPGKHAGHLRVPWPRNVSAWGALEVPLVVVRGAPGPTALLVAGQHGDELEGPVILSELCRTLEPEHVRGRVILLPAFNVSGLAAGSRLAAADGRDPNRSYPGEREGSPTQMLCHFLDTTLVGCADFVLDLHSGGRSLVFLPSILMHPVPDAQARRRTRAALEAFGAPTGVVIEEVDLMGCLDDRVERRGTPFLFAELGGGARLTPHSLGVGRRGVWNLLEHLEIVGPDHPGRVPTTGATSRILDVTEGTSFVRSPDAGVMEPLVELGDDVRTGQPIARLHRVTHPSAEPVVLAAGRDGVVCALRALALTEPGDTLALVAGPESG